MNMREYIENSAKLRDRADRLGLYDASGNPDPWQIPVIADGMRPYVLDQEFSEDIIVRENRKTGETEADTRARLIVEAKAERARLQKEAEAGANAEADAAKGTPAPATP